MAKLRKSDNTMAENQTIRVLAVDDHELLRRGIYYSLLTADDVDVVGEAQNGEEALRQCAEVKPNVVLMDMRMPGEMDGIATTRAIRAQFPQVQVVALSSFFDQQLVHSAMQAGAISYLVKGVSGQELTNAIRAAYAGQSTLTAEALDMLVQPVEPTHQKDYDLTARETEVLALLVEGLSNAEIAKCLYVSVAAIKYHVSSILSKLGVANRTEAAVLAREHNLVPKP